MLYTVHGEKKANCIIETKLSGDLKNENYQLKHILTKFFLP